MRTLAALGLLVAVSAHAGEVTVIRPSAFIGNDATYYVVLDGKPLLDLESREHARFDVPAGRHVLAVRCPKPLYGTYAETRLERDFGAAGAFFVLEPKFDCVTIEPVEARAAASLTGNTRLRPDRQSSYEDGGVAPSDAQAQAKPPSAKEDPAALTGAWIDAFNSRDPGRLAGLYADDAVLLATTASRPAVGAAAIAAYFRDAASRPMDRVALGEHTLRVYGDTAVDSGLYNFFQVEQGKATVTPARYTFVYRRREGKWTIVEHHSSRVP